MAVDPYYGFYGGGTSKPSASSGSAGASQVVTAKQLIELQQEEQAKAKAGETKTIISTKEGIEVQTLKPYEEKTIGGQKVIIDPSYRVTYAGVKLSEPLSKEYIALVEEQIRQGSYESLAGKVEREQQLRGLPYTPAYFTPAPPELLVSVKSKPTGYKGVGTALQDLPRYFQEQRIKSEAERISRLPPDVSGYSFYVGMREPVEYKGKKFQYGFGGSVDERLIYQTPASLTEAEKFKQYILTTEGIGATEKLGLIGEGLPILYGQTIGEITGGFIDIAAQTGRTFYSKGELGFRPIYAVKSGTQALYGLGEFSIRAGQILTATTPEAEQYRKTGIIFPFAFETGKFATEAVVSYGILKGTKTAFRIPSRGVRAVETRLVSLREKFDMGYIGKLPRGEISIPKGAESPQRIIFTDVEQLPKPIKSGLGDIGVTKGKIEISQEITAGKKTALSAATGEGVLLQFGKKVKAAELISELKRPTSPIRFEVEKLIGEKVDFSKIEITYPEIESIGIAYGLKGSGFITKGGKVIGSLPEFEGGRAVSFTIPERIEYLYFPERLEIGSPKRQSLPYIYRELTGAEIAKIRGRPYGYSFGFGEYEVAGTTGRLASKILAKPFYEIPSERAFLGATRFISDLGDYGVLRQSIIVKTPQKIKPAVPKDLRRFFDMPVRGKMKPFTSQVQIQEELQQVGAKTGVTASLSLLKTAQKTKGGQVLFGLQKIKQGSISRQKERETNIFAEVSRVRPMQQPISGVRQPDITMQRLRTSSSSISRIIQPDIAIAKNTSSSSISRIIQPDIAIAKTRMSDMLGTRISSITYQPTMQKTRTTQIIRTLPVSYVPPPVPPDTPLLKIVSQKRYADKISMPALVPAYNVFVRRFGRFIPVGQKLTYARAIKKGIEKTERTPARSFKLRPAGYVASRQMFGIPEKLRRQYYKKIEKGEKVFVEKAKFAINIPFELGRKFLRGRFI